MVYFNLNTFLLSVSCASTAIATPWPLSAKHSTHRTRDVGDRKLEAFHPPSSFEIFDKGIDQPVAFSESATLEKSSVAFVRSKLGINDTAIRFAAGFSNELGKRAWMAQVHEKIPFSNAVANVVFNKQNQIVAFGSSFVKPGNFAPSEPSISADSATAIAENALNGKFNGHRSVEYLARQDGSASLAHAIQIQNKEIGTWVKAFIDAHNGGLLSVTDFVSQASYRAIPFNKLSPDDGFEIIQNPEDLAASPLGWHDDGTVKTDRTSGNNAVSFKTSPGNQSKESSSPLIFNYTQDPSLDPSAAVNVDAARVNAFYFVNTMHDIAYRYGFTEAAFNFQTNNFGRGGVDSDSDRVVIQVQASDHLNNAFFITPPDGISGEMHMFLFNLTNPRRDGALESDVVIHEMTHGISNRMTGGGTAACLQTLESGGMGEGWSDSVADWAHQTEDPPSSRNIKDFALGQFVTNTTKGIRTHPYSISPETNPLKYSDVGKLNEVHKIGEVWANMLHNLLAALVKAHGFSNDARTDPASSAGNVVFLHLLIDGFSIQPCNPTFRFARDAILLADEQRYNGANKCLIWNSFASRGLGLRATGAFKDDSSVPFGC